MSDLKNLFKAEQFMLDPENARCAAEKAQAILNEALASAPRVYQLEPRRNYGWYQEQPHMASQYNMTGLLVCIEELKPKECEHERLVNIFIPTNNYTNGKIDAPSGGITSHCEACGAKLKAKWEEA